MPDLPANGAGSVLASVRFVPLGSKGAANQ